MLIIHLQIIVMSHALCSVNDMSYCLLIPSYYHSRKHDMYVHLSNSLPEIYGLIIQEVIMDNHDFDAINQDAEIRSATNYSLHSRFSFLIG